MEIYKRLMEDPLFFKWIYQPNEKIESFWEQYLESNPGEANLIIEFKSQFEKHLLYKNEKLTELERKALAKKIINQFEKVDIQKKRYSFIKATMRYAAVALVFFTIGSSLVYMYMHSRQSAIIVENSILPAYVQKPLLIIEDKEEIKLNQGSSELDYSNNGRVVLNKEKTIINEPDNETPELNTLVIPYGSRSVIKMADGTKVWLNAGSRLIYPSKFVDKERVVYLVGEAFFDVERKEDQPFIVKTTDIEVNVLGTSFNISAYPDDRISQTVLTEGSIEVNKVNSGLFERGVRLVPGQMASYNKQKRKTRVLDVNVEHYSLWTKGLFSFNDADLSRIIKKLERFYGIQFKYKDPFIGSIKITGKMDVTREREEVLEYLSKLTHVRFKKISETIYELN